MKKKKIIIIEDQGKKQVETLKGLDLKNKNNGKSDGNSSISKEIDDKLLDERMDKIVQLSREINFNYFTILKVRVLQ